MQTTIKKTGAKPKRETLPQNDTPKSQDEKLKKTSYNASTPRSYIQKSSTADIYGQNRKMSAQSAKAPKKSPKTAIDNPSPMKDYLKSTPSTTSVASTITLNDKAKILRRRTDPRPTQSAAKDFNTTINSPAVKRRLNLDKEKSFIKETSRREASKKASSKEDIQTPNAKANERQRTKTRTLNENEVKILTSEVVDNNSAMYNLSKKLSAQPKTFFVDLDNNKAPQIEKQPSPKTPSDEEISYEDDFEAYESDFDSYHSSSPSDANDADDKSDRADKGDDEDKSAEVESKETKDEERMLDSGNFDLRDQRSATKTKPALDFILETVEGSEDKRSSLTDEGFQEMSSSSAVSSMKTVHVDVLDRPLFIDFTKSKENKRKNRINERLRQRANDLLSIITLHEMSYNLFEMKPISYDLFMATFGRSNYQQVAVQTFDDGITEEIQTDDIECENKWTQHPVEFSNSDICINNVKEKRKYSQNMEDYLTKFTFLTKQTLNVEKNHEIISNENYITNPLRIFFEQKDGVGPSEMLPYESYKSKLKSNDYNTHRLGKFLKKMESSVCNILNNNIGNTEMTDLLMTNLPFSKGYVNISTKSLTDKKYSFLTSTNISQIYLSETNNNLVMTVHNEPQKPDVKKCFICLWNTGVARGEPIKILTAVDNVAIGRFIGATDGFFIAALVDGSIHFWDLSERPMWSSDVASDENSDKLVQVLEKDLTMVERDREWNKKNSHIGLNEVNIHCPLQACAFTNSAHNMSNGDFVRDVVGLEFVGNLTGRKEGRRVIGQVVALQRTGVLTIWLIIQEKSKTIPPDIGKAFWSKMKLEKTQTISLVDHIDSPLKYSEKHTDFNLNAAKKRLQNRKLEKNILKPNSRPKSAVDINRPTSAASVKNKKVLPVKGVSENYESGIVCYDLKIMFWNNSGNYLIAKNCGEIICCNRTFGAVRVNRFCITTDASSVTCIEVSPHKLPYYLAATDGGTINVCSLLENRVLLSLDCRDTLAAMRFLLFLKQEYTSLCDARLERNIPNQTVEKCQADHKGRFVSTMSNKTYVGADTKVNSKLRINSISWSRINPCCIFAAIDGSIVSWHLSHSDINAKCASDDAATACVAGDSILALLTLDGEVHVHKLSNEHKTKEFLLLFEKYVALL